MASLKQLIIINWYKEAPKQKYTVIFNIRGSSKKLHPKVIQQMNRKERMQRNVAQTRNHDFADGIREKKASIES